MCGVCVLDTSTPPQPPRRTHKPRLYKSVRLSRYRSYSVIGNRAITTSEEESSMAVGQVLVSCSFLFSFFCFFFWKVLFILSGFGLVWFRLHNNNNNDNKMVEFSHLNINWHIKW